ncbi:M48 family metalloprotease [Ramlibacter sp. PS3R-8]|uniref:M48 family metalloprotease n=1 Tax=Ramlibacter sp. PS3R-8 TaxID=3133437 RepID=UPI0030AB5C6D
MLKMFAMALIGGVVGGTALGAGIGTEHADRLEQCNASMARPRAVDAPAQAELKRMAAAPAVPVPEAVQQVFRRLSAAARLTNVSRKARLVAVDSETPASVNSSGTVFLSSRLWTGELPLNGDEIAAVIAHELAHLEEADPHHQLCEAVAAIRDVGLSSSQIFARARQAMAGDPQLAIWMIRRNHLRELHADRRGADLLAAVGINPGAMARMLIKITPAGQGDYSGSHPAIEARIENLTAPLE